MLVCQLGRTDASAKSPVPSSMPPLNLFTGEVSHAAVADAFRSSGLTEREMTALLGCLLSVDSIEKATPEGDWKKSSKPKFREAGKIGRMSEFKKLTDEDIANELAKDDEDEERFVIEGDDDWYIADTFGTQEDRFGKRVASEKIEFNTALKNLGKSGGNTQYGWISDFLLSKGACLENCCCLVCVAVFWIVVSLGLLVFSLPAHMLIISLTYHYMSNQCLIMFSLPT